jgi:hypothetical protein
MKRCTICGTTTSRNDVFPRGLCTRDYARLYKQDELWDYPRTTWPRAELIAEYEHLRAQGNVRDHREAAEILGIKPESLRRAIYRSGRTPADYPEKCKGERI